MPVADAHVPALTLEGRTGLSSTGTVTPQDHKTFECDQPLEKTGQSIVTPSSDAWTRRRPQGAARPSQSPMNVVVNASRAGEHPSHAYDRPVGPARTKSPPRSQPERLASP